MGETCKYTTRNALLTDGITNGQDPSIRYASIIKKMNTIDKKTYPSIIYVIIPMNLIKTTSVIIASKTVTDRIKPTNYL